MRSSTFSASSPSISNDARRLPDEMVVGSVGNELEADIMARDSACALSVFAAHTA